MNCIPRSTLAGRLSLYWWAVLFLMLTPVLAHLAFSWMGFNAGDQGLILAGSRRLLQGQWPWRDFYAWHPPLPYLLHQPLAAVAGEYVFWWARLVVWFELAAAAWCAAGLVCRRWLLEPRRRLQPLLALTALAVSAHNFPLDLHPALDAWFFCAIGLYLVDRGGMTAKTFGYLALGAAVVCRLSFVLPGAAALLVCGDWRRARFWLCLLLPALGVALWLGCSGLLPAAMMQMAAGEGWGQGFRWLRLRSGGFILAGYLGMRFLRRDPPLNWPRPVTVAAGWLLLGCWPVWRTCHGLARGEFHVAAFGLFWLAAGVFAYLALDNRRRQPESRNIMLLALAAAAAVTPGQTPYPSPALGAGMLLLAATAWLLAVVRPRVRVGLALLMAVLLISAMSRGRLEHGRYEQPADRLTCPLAAVLPGGGGILVNTNVYAFLADFQQAREIAVAEGRPLAVIPEIPAYWVCAAQTNGMPADAMVAPRYASTNLEAMLQTETLARGTNMAVLMQKTHGLRLDLGMRRLPGRWNSQVARHLSRNMRKAGETDYFIVYAPSPAGPE